jgi:hypothetical protein
MKRKLLTVISAAILMAPLASLQAAPITFADFNVNLGTFNSTATASGSTAGIATSSTSTRVTTNPFEGAGCNQLVFITNGAATVRIRHLSGGGTPANNTAFITSGDTDGWIGFYLKTTNAGWDVQIWLEGASNNGSIRKQIIADGQWHLYEWDLDNTAGDADGWGDITSIIGGSPTVADGSHTIDSILFRNLNPPAPLESQTNVIFLDFVVKTDSGSIADYIAANPCLITSGALPIGPVATNSNQVTVSGISAAATEVKVFQNSGVAEAMVLIGTKNSGITAGNNAVTVSGLALGARVVATQVVAGQESCLPSAVNGVMVGGGANPSIRAALTVRDTPSTGPIGSTGISTNGNLYFLNATTVSGGAPIDAGIIYPSNGWQTVTFLRGTNEVVGDAANAAGTPVAAAGYAPNDSVSISVYAYRNLPNGVRIYSLTAATSTEVSSNDVFAVNWSWTAVSGANGYRLLRSVNFGGYNESVDVANNSYNDANTGWDPEITVTPNSSQPGRSVKWNTQAGDPLPVGTTNQVPGQWAILDSISLAIHNSDNTGPFNFYIDNFQNGSTVFQTFEDAPANTTDYAFRAPTFSGSTSGSILTSPDVGRVSNSAADSGTKSFQVSFQWNNTNITKWLRLTTSGVNNPQVNLDLPISFRLLMQPVNATLPTPPTAPALTVSRVADKTVLNWTGGHRLQAAVGVTGVYTNVPQVRSANTWTNVTLGAFLSPWTNNFTEPTRFFRLVD